MGVIQSSVNQAIGAAGQAAGLVKVLGNQKKLGLGQGDLMNVTLMTEQERKEFIKRKHEKERLQEDKENAKKYGMTLKAYQKWENELHDEEMAETRAHIEEEAKRENELRKQGLRQSFAAELKAKQDLKAHERLRNSPLGGDFNG